MARFGNARQTIGAYLEALSRIPEYQTAAEQELRRLKRRAAVSSYARASVAGVAADRTSGMRPVRIAAQEG